MAVYNTEKEFLEQSIQSILNQTYTDFEFIIIDDYSNEETQEFLKTFTDSRIQIHRNPENQGLTKSLNNALSYAKGTYIARMDSDDISLPNRFETQIRYMEAHPECGVCGSLVEMYGASFKYWTRYSSDHEIKRVRMLFYNAGIVHPTAFIRRSVMDENNIRYRENIKKAQDYALWADMIQVTDIQLIPEVLLKYRVSENQISNTSHGQQVQFEHQTILRQLEHFDLTDKEKESITLFYRGEAKSQKVLNTALSKLITQNKVSKLYNPSVFEQQIVVLYMQAALKKLSRGHSPAMLASKYFWKVLIPSNFIAFRHYWSAEKITAD